MPNLYPLPHTLRRVWAFFPILIKQASEALSCLDREVPDHLLNRFVVNDVWQIGLAWHGSGGRRSVCTVKKKLKVVFLPSSHVGEVAMVIFLL